MSIKAECFTESSQTTDSTKTFSLITDIQNYEIQLHCKISLKKSLAHVLTLNKDKGQKL
jgi:hypothetical protein